MSQKQYHILEWLRTLGVALLQSTDTFCGLFLAWPVVVYENSVSAGP